MSSFHKTDVIRRVQHSSWQNGATEVTWYEVTSAVVPSETSLNGWMSLYCYIGENILWYTTSSDLWTVCEFRLVVEIELFQACRNRTLM